ncbi:Protein SKG6 [Cyberlindnera fabianii]|uniref:Protein SKG6 n=1 Tax=Cyberlindnera fabianii TaxID=36022 RepID=A0A1V2LE59_CYBFA|nr:Protein SKG6 [Cyberlindnera fabianii]
MDNYLPTETEFVFPTPSQIYASPTSLTTSFVNLQIRATSSDDESSSSSKKHTTRKHTKSRCNDAQRCETGSSTTPLTIALAVTIPTVVFLSIIGFFMFRSYKKGRAESKDDNDPDFYGETTILPDYPSTRPTGPNDDSLYSHGQNPFALDNARYPSAALAKYNNPSQSRSMSRGSPSMNTVQADPYYESFTLPYSHNLGSKQSLDEFAKNLGSEYQAYQISSRPGSRPQSPYRSTNSSALNLAHNDPKMRHLTEKSTNSYEGETTDSPYSYNETKVNTDNILDDEQSVVTRDVFADPERSTQQQHTDKRNSDMSYLEDEPEHLNTTHDSVLRSQEEATGDQTDDGDDDETAATTSKGVNFDAKADDEDEEEDEDIKRMKSVYKVYFDRENSVKKPGNTIKAPSIDVPPLPDVDIDSTIQQLESEDKVGELEQPVGHLGDDHKIDYGSVVSSTEYAPTKSLTGGTRENLTVKPFNPLHYSDQIFSPTSPSSPTFSQFQAPDQFKDAAPPSPHHLTRQSVVMVDPVGIGKQKIYRPAGSFSQMNSANSSRAGSLTSQSQYPQPSIAASTSDAELLPRSGSKADLRQQLGASENYNFM